MNRADAGSSASGQRFGKSGANVPSRLAGSDLQTRYERCVNLARTREAAGDRIEAERLYQQADHYRRLMNASAA